MKKHIYIYSPSGAVRDKTAFKRGVKRLQTLGHEVEVDDAALASHQRFAGDDATRLAAIHRAAASGADVAMISRGGYGLTRILGGINYKAVAKSIDKGTQFVGFSDFTALQMALFAKTGQMSWTGPALCDDFGVGQTAVEPDGHGTLSAPLPDDIMEDCFNDMIVGQGEGAGWRQHPESKSNAIKNIAAIARPEPVVATIHSKNAVLWGGNLAVLTSLVGTPYFPHVKNGILFLEDVAEHPYRIERMLAQLLHAGVLAQQKAIVLGQFTAFKLTSHDRGFKLQSVVDWLRSQLKIPVLTNLPCGHVPTKVLLPFGAKVDLLVQGRDALLVWGHLH
jgi:muramoyltetrapeptide carboxypeptidase